MHNVGRQEKGASFGPRPIRRYARQMEAGWKVEIADRGACESAERHDCALRNRPVASSRAVDRLLDLSSMSSDGTGRSARLGATTRAPFGPSDIWR
jgi:hypothetical protein